MIFDLLSKADLYKNIHPRMSAAFQFLKDNDIPNLADGKYELDGSNLFAIVSSYDTKAREMGKWECHQKYIDIQYVASGIELIGYAPIASMTVCEAYDETRDVAFLEGEGNYVVVPQAYFAIFHPHDVHRPNLSVKESAAVKKVVVKIKLDM